MDSNLANIRFSEVGTKFIESGVSVKDKWKLTLLSQKGEDSTKSKSEIWTGDSLCS